MHKINFLPEEYRKNNRKTAILILVFITVTINIVALIKTLYNIKELNEINDKIQKAHVYTSKDVKKNRSEFYNKDCIDEFTRVYDFLHPLVVCCNLTVNEKEINIGGKIKSVDEYIAFLENIENSKSYRIKGFTQLHKKEDYINLNMKLEVIK